MHFLAGERNPAAERFIFGKRFKRGVISPIDVFGIAGQRYPPEWAAAFAEERADVLWHEAGDAKGIGDAGCHGLSTDVVAVLEGDGTGFLQVKQSAHVNGDGFERSALIFLLVIT